MRLLHAQAPMENDRKLCEYSLPEGATISALFEPDVNINIEVSTHHERQKLKVSNTTSVKALKVQISGVMRCYVAPEKLEIRLGDITLEDLMPLHFYGVQNGTKLELLKPYVGVMIENNFGHKIYWRLKRKDFIKDVKVKVASTQKSLTPESVSQDEIDKGGIINAEGLRIYLVTNGSNFNELDDDGTVEDCKLKDGDNLYLLSYRWLSNQGVVTVRKTGMNLQGVEAGDTCLGIKLRVQDQMGLQVGTLSVFHMIDESCHVEDYFDEDYQNPTFKDDDKPFSTPSDNYYDDEKLIVFTHAELHAQYNRREEQRRAEQARRGRKEQRGRRGRRGYYY